MTAIVIVNTIMVKHCNNHLWKKSFFGCGKEKKIFENMVLIFSFFSWKCKKVRKKIQR